jgi:hypothetical protein
MSRDSHFDDYPSSHICTVLQHACFEYRLSILCDSNGFHPFLTHCSFMILNSPSGR